MSATAEAVTAVEGELVDNGLVLPEKESGLLAELKKSGKRLDLIEKEWAELPDVETKEGMKLAKSRRAELVSMRTGGGKNKLAITKPLRDLTDSVNQLWKKYLPRIESIESKYDDAIKAVEKAKEEAKRAAAEAEAKRVESHNRGLKKITDQLQSMSIEDVEHSIEFLNDTSFEDFEEFEPKARSLAGEIDGLLRTRLQTIKEQAAEATRLAEQKAEQDRIAAEQKEAADKLAAELQEMEQWKKEKAEREERERREADEKEASRIADLKRGIAEIESAAERLETIASIDAYLNDLEYGNESDFEEFADEAARAIANAKPALTEKRRQLIAEAEEAEYDEALAENARRDQAAADLKAAEEAGAKRERERKKAEKAEAARLKKLEPEVEQLRAYIVELNEVQTPEFKSPELIEALATITDQLQDMTEIPDSLTTSAAA